MPGVAETFKTFIDKMTHGTTFTLVKLLHAKSVTLTQEDLNTGSDEPEDRWSMHLVSYDTLTFRAMRSSHSQLSYCACSFGILDESNRYKTKNSVGWQIAMNAKIGFKLHVTVTLGYHSLYVWCCQMMCLFSSVPDDPEDDTLIEQHGADALYSTVKSLMDAI